MFHPRNAAAALGLGVASLASSFAVPADIKDVCSVGLFVNPTQLSMARARVGDDAFAPAWRWLEGRLGAASRGKAIDVYRGRSSWSFADRARTDLVQAGALALFAALSVEEARRDAAIKTARRLLAKWVAEVPEFADDDPMDGRSRTAESMRDYAGEGLYLSLVAIGVGHAYHLLRCHSELPEKEEVAIRTWLKKVADKILVARSRWADSGYFGGQFANNHLAMHNAAVYSIGVLTKRQHLMRWAYDSPENPKDFKDLLRDAIYDGKETVADARDRVGDVPSRGEIVDRYRMVQGAKGLHYAVFHYAALEMLAEAASNQGVDAYLVTADSGESLIDPLIYYATMLGHYRCSSNAKVLLDDKNYVFYRGAPIEPYYWTWLEPALNRLQHDPRVRAVSNAMKQTRCSEFHPPYLPIPFYSMTHGS